MVASAVAAVAAVEQASAIQQPFMERAATRKTGRRQALRLRRLLLEACLLLLTRKGAVQTTRRQLQAVTAADGGGGSEGVPLGTGRPVVASADKAPVGRRRDAGRARRRGLAAAALRLRQLLLCGCVQVAWRCQSTSVSGYAAHSTVM